MRAIVVPVMERKEKSARLRRVLARYRGGRFETDGNHHFAFAFLGDDSKPFETVPAVSNLPTAARCRHTSRASI